MLQVREERFPRSAHRFAFVTLSLLALAGCVQRHPHLDVSTRNIELGRTANSGSFTVHNSSRDLLFTSGVTPLEYQVHTDVDWMTVTPSSGTCGEDEKKTHVVKIQRSSLGDGDHVGLILITSNGGDATIVIHFVNGGGVTCTTPPSDACSPNPPDEKTGVNENTNLAWGCGDSACGLAVEYDVYFGTTATPGGAQLAGTATTKGWSLPTLAKNTTYYWKVVTRDANGSNSGPVWSFKTRK